MNDETPIHQYFEVETAPEVEPGVYADFANLWHTADVFVIDFAALRQPPQPGEDDSGQQVIKVPTRIVARVRIPPGQVFELMKALEAQLSAWERETGHEPGSGDSD